MDAQSTGEDAWRSVACGQTSPRNSVAPNAVDPFNKEAGPGIAALVRIAGFITAQRLASRPCPRVVTIRVGEVTVPSRMSSRQFRESLSALGLLVEDWARITGVRRQRILRWCHDEERIPAWVSVLSAALSVPEAKHCILSAVNGREGAQPGRPPSDDESGGKPNGCENQARS
jgi:hypothetical protein